jgi:hypothetical protein
VAAAAPPTPHTHEELTHTPALIKLAGGRRLRAAFDNVDTLGEGSGGGKQAACRMVPPARFNGKGHTNRRTRTQNAAAARQWH